MAQNPYPWVITPFATAADPPITSGASLIGGKTATVINPYAPTHIDGTLSAAVSAVSLSAAGTV